MQLIQINDSTRNDRDLQEHVAVFENLTVRGLADEEGVITASGTAGLLESLGAVRGLFAAKRNETLEQDVDLRQLVAYFLLYDADTKGLYSYWRTKAGEERLDGKRSVGLGGHVHVKDLADKDLLRSLMQAADRELAEEAPALRKAGPWQIVGGLAVEKGEVLHRVHLGIVFAAQVRREQDAADGEIGKLELAPVAEYLENLSQFELWSQLVLRRMADVPAVPV